MCGRVPDKISRSGKIEVTLRQDCVSQPIVKQGCTTTQLLSKALALFNTYRALRCGGRCQQTDRHAQAKGRIKSQHKQRHLSTYQK